jgi:hypothetical protein
VPASPPLGPGPLAWVHLLTIGTGLLGALAYLAWEVMQWRSDAPDGSSWRVLAALAAVTAIGTYLWNLRARLRAKLTPGGSA